MSDKENKYKVWDYIKIVKSANIHEISSALRLSNLEVITIVEELQRENYLIRVPITLDKSKNCGCYYAANGKELSC